MGERLKLHVSFLPLLCQLVPGSFMITSSSPSLYIFSSHIKAHVLKLCSLDSVFPIHAGIPVSVQYNVSATHHTPWWHMEGFVQASSTMGPVLLFLSFFSFFDGSFCICSSLTMGDHWLRSSNRARNRLFDFAWQLFCPYYSRGQAGFHTCLKSLENTVLWEPRWGSSWYWTPLEMSLTDLLWY